MYIIVLFRQFETMLPIRTIKMIEQIMTVKDVATYLKLNERTVYRMALSAKIPAFKLGASWRFKKEEIDNWIAQQHNQISSNKES